MGQRSFSVVQISDLHLNPADAAAMERIDHVRRQVAQLAPDLIVASGDISADGFMEEGVLEQVKAELDKFSAPVLVIPGNHDVGHKASVTDEAIKPEYLQKWKHVFGDDRFCVERDNWMLIGIDTQIVGSGFPEEAQQLAWLDEKLDAAKTSGRSVAMFLHAPPYLKEPEEVFTDQADYWVIDSGPRRKLLKRIHRPHVRLMAHGHLHWHLTFERGNLTWVWCPSVAFIVDDANYPRGGGVGGMMQYQFTDDGVTHKLLPLDLPVPTVFIHRPKVQLGDRTITVAELVCDFAAITHDGELAPDVRQQLGQIGRTVRVTVLTRGDMDQAQHALDGLDVEVKAAGNDADNARYVRELHAQRVAVIAGADNSTQMFDAAAIGICICDAHAPSAGQHTADIEVASAGEALDLILHPQRLSSAFQVGHS